MKGLMMPFPLTLGHVVERAERLFPTTEVVSRVSDEAVVRSTFGETILRARRLAAALRAEGLRPGDRVATLMWNHHVNFETYLGVPLAGGVLLPLNLRLKPSELQFIVAQATPRWLLVDAGLWPIYEKIQRPDQNWSLRVVGPGHPEAAAAIPSYDPWIGGFSPQETAADAEEDDAVGLFYTTGTTGVSKGILYSHRSTILHAFVMGLSFELTHRDVICDVMSMSHAHSAGQPHIATLLGSKLVFPGPSPDPVTLLNLFERERVTFTAAVVQVWAGVLDALDREPGRWKLAPGFRCVTGGSALPETMIRRFDQHGIQVIHIWGMTETGPIATVSRPKRHLEALARPELDSLRASQGIPIPFLEVRTRPTPGVRVHGDQEGGELEVRGPWVARAYYDQAGKAERWTGDGWFRSGDVASIDAEGYVRILDRLGDLVKVGDEWANSIEIESKMMDHPAVREAAVVARIDPDHGEQVHAVVALRPGASASVEDLDRFLQERIPDLWHPVSYSFVDAIPRTSVGKISKQTLRDDLSAGKLKAVRVAAPALPPPAEVPSGTAHASTRA